MRIAMILMLMPGGLCFAQDDTKIKRGVEAPAPANQPPPPAVSPLAEKVYAVPSLVLAGISAVLIIGAICLPIKRFDGEE